MPYLPDNSQTLTEMLKVIGKESFEELIQYIPAQFRLNRDLNLPEPLAEYELEEVLNRSLQQSACCNRLICFAGGGVYDHFVPAVAPFLSSRSEFYTAYTPYQPEVSQGTLQFYFEFQSLICDLTQMEAANASMYDGASATAEAVLMAARIHPGKRILVSEGLHPHIKKVIDTYNYGLKIPIEAVPLKDGALDPESLNGYPLDSIAAIVVQSPNYYGTIEWVQRIREKLLRPILLILNSQPIALGILKKPGALGVDIFISDGQSLGNGIYFGGPTCGIFAARKEYIRHMPGRIAGITEDTDGRMGFVTTLQTREQHIRRAKATSNICTAQALNALISTIFLAAMGSEGIYQMANQSAQKSHYLANEITRLPGYQLLNNHPFFNEFVVETPVMAETIIRAGVQQGILPGICLPGKERENQLMIAVTEKRNRADIERLLELLKQFAR